MIYDTRDPAKVLGHMEGLTVEGAFILKDFHRHLEDPVVYAGSATSARSFKPTAAL